jgi:putative SOS response-associated peptidase YedK
LCGRRRGLPRVLARMGSMASTVASIIFESCTFAIAMKDGRPFTFAGLWEGWKDPESAEWLRTCTIITGEPNELVAQIHPRMPVILPEQHHATWLAETDDGGLKELLLPYPADKMRMREISPRVNSAEE